MRGVLLRLFYGIIVIQLINFFSFPFFAGTEADLEKHRNELREVEKRSVLNHYNSNTIARRRTRRLPYTHYFTHTHSYTRTYIHPRTQTHTQACDQPAAGGRGQHRLQAASHSPTGAARYAVRPGPRRGAGEGP